MNTLKDVLGKPNARAITGLTLIVGVTLIIYYPSFSHLLRGETYTYLMDVQGEDRIIPLMLNWTDYTLVGNYTGDPLIFRPLFFVVLGIEKALFGMNYTYWRIAIFCAHILATICLYRLLWKIKPGIIAFSATLLFATTYIALSTILYEHIIAFALFTALALSALYYIYQGTKEMNNRKLYIGGGCTLLACLFYDLGLLFAISMAVYFYLERKRFGSTWKRWSGLYLLGIPTYLAMYLPPRIVFIKNREGVLSNLFNTWINPSNIFLGIKYSYIIVNTWITQTFLPTLYYLKPNIDLFAWSATIRPTIKSSSVLYNMLNFTTIISLIGLIKMAGRKFTQLIKNPFFILVTCMIISYIVPVSIIRAAPRGLYSVLGKNFHAHTFLALGIVWVYIIMSIEILKSKTARDYIAIALIILACISGVKVFELNQEIKIAEQPIRTYFHQIDEFIELHQYEEDFSFYATTIPIIQDRFQLPAKYSAKAKCNVTIPRVLYWDYWSEENPKYILTYYLEKERLEVKINE